MDDVGLYQRLFAIGPECLVHDLHPDYVTTRYARERAEAEGIGLLAVQHHHAHMASCMAKNRLTEPVIGVTFDGTGHGTDGKIWGGEFLVGDYRRFRRAAHLRPVGMPGGDRAIREPWRMAVAHLADAGLESAPGASPFPEDRARLIRRMLERRLNTAMTSSAGRLFDAVAALAGVRACVRYEGQAAIELEWLASGVAPDGAYPFEFHPGDGGRTRSPRWSSTPAPWSARPRTMPRGGSGPRGSPGDSTRRSSRSSPRSAARSARRRPSMRPSSAAASS